MLLRWKTRSGCVEVAESLKARFTCCYWAVVISLWKQCFSGCPAVFLPPLVEKVLSVGSPTYRLMQYLVCRHELQTRVTAPTVFIKDVHRWCHQHESSLLTSLLFGPHFLLSFFFLSISSIHLFSTFLLDLFLSLLLYSMFSLSYLVSLISSCYSSSIFSNLSSLLRFFFNLLSSLISFLLFCQFFSALFYCYRFLSSPLFSSLSIYSHLFASVVNSLPPLLTSHLFSSCFHSISLSSLCFLHFPFPSPSLRSLHLLIPSSLCLFVSLLLSSSPFSHLSFSYPSFSHVSSPLPFSSDP